MSANILNTPTQSPELTSGTNLNEKFQSPESFKKVATFFFHRDTILNFFYGWIFLLKIRNITEHQVKQK